MGQLGIPGGKYSLDLPLQAQLALVAFVLCPAVCDRLERLLLLPRDLELSVDRSQVIELLGHLRGALERGSVIQHQLAEHLVDAVELFEAGSTIEQRKGVLSHLEETSQMRQVLLLVVADMQA